MRKLFFTTFVVAGTLCLFAFPYAQAQSSAPKLFSANCELCHGTDGAGTTPTGKALHAKDLRSEEVQSQSDEVLRGVITKGKGKMPTFGTKMKPDDITKLLAYVRTLALKK
jgi:cytochrome c6